MPSRTRCAAALSFLSTVLFGAPGHADPFLAAPGRSLGSVHLGLRGGADLKRLPKPDGGDAAMGGLRSEVWKSKNTSDTLAIEGMTQSVLDPPQPGFRVDEIHATSPLFHTANGLSSGATLAQIKRRYLRGSLASAGEANSAFYTVRQGIAFEFPAHPAAYTRCVAVSVFAPGRTPHLTVRETREFLLNK